MSLTVVVLHLLFHFFLQQVSSSCPPLSGTFSVHYPQVFPESADWDSVHCKLWMSATYNATILVYDPYTGSSDVITLEGITGDTDYHLEGIDYDERTGTMFVAASSATAFDAGPAGFLADNLTGPNRIMQFDTNTYQLIYEADLAGVQAQVLAATGQHTNGFQDMAEDSNGNTYAIGTFGNTIAKIDNCGNVSLYFQPDASVYNESIYGFGGIFAWENKLVINDAASQGFVVFDTEAPGPATPVYVKPKNFPQNYTALTDGLYAPAKYSGRIALWCDDFVNDIIVVYGSLDGWQSAEYLGKIANNFAVVGKGLPTATVQIADSIFIVEEFFQETQPIANISSFPFVDITRQVDHLFTSWYYV